MFPELSPHSKSQGITSTSRRFASLLRDIRALLLAKEKTAADEGRHAKSATVGVVVCAYNEEHNIGPLLTDLIKERVDEIVVVASGCTDTTVEIVREYEAKHRNVTLVVEEKRSGKTSAVNLALRLVRSDFLIFLPADVRPAEGSISKLITGFKPEVGIRVGRPSPIDERSNTMGKLSHLMWTLHNRTLMELSAKGDLGHASGEFFAIRRGIISELPSYVVNEDAYIAIVARRAGFRIEFEDNAIAYMRGPGTVSDYVSQRRRVHFGHIQVMKSTGNYPTTFEEQVLLRPALFFRLLRDELRILGGGLRELLFGGALEVVSLLLSGFDRVLGKTHVVWRMVESTKNLSGPMSIPMGAVGGTGLSQLSRLDAYPAQSLDRSWRSGLTRDQLSPRSAAVALRPYMCY